MVFMIDSSSALGSNSLFYYYNIGHNLKCLEPLPMILRAHVVPGIEPKGLVLGVSSQTLRSGSLGMTCRA